SSERFFSRCLPWCPGRFLFSAPAADVDPGILGRGERTMSTFYLLPSRPILGQRFANYLQKLFPGLDWPGTSWGDLADVLGTTATRHPDVYVVYREELPEGEDLDQALAHGFGAELGDEVIEVFAGTTPAETATQRWRLGTRV